MDRSNNPVQKLAERFDIPADALPGTALITMTGNRRLHIDRHRGILEYGREFISINCGSIIVGVYGQSLELASMSSSEMLIIGDVQRVEFT